MKRLVCEKRMRLGDRSLSIGQLYFATLSALYQTTNKVSITHFYREIKSKNKVFQMNWNESAYDLFVL